MWSQRIALWFLLLFLITFVFHRFVSLSTPVAMKLFGVAVAGAVISFVLGVTALMRIWREGYLGAGRAMWGVVISALMLALPLWSLPSLLSLPRLHEVSTDTSSPPAFQAIARARRGEANPVSYQPAAAKTQAKAYPDIQPVSIDRSSSEAFSAVREAVKTLDWRIVSEQPPERGKSGMIEAVDRSLIFGFTDDVVIRVSGGDSKARIDVRSSSRYGQHDLGRNATRVRQLIAEVKTRITEIERNEQMRKAVLQREEIAKRVRKKAEGKRGRYKRKRRRRSRPRYD